jgi:serine/threonine protein phosphatase 1
MHYYVIPDIHGCNTLLQKALAEIYRQNPKGGKIIFLGDYIDRGEDNLGVIKTVMNPPMGWEFVCLIGNHELMLIDSLETGYPFYDRLAAIELAGYERHDLVTDTHIRQGILPEIRQWLQTLKHFHIEDRNVFAHAYYDDTVSPQHQQLYNLVWTRMSDFETYHNNKQGLYLVHGHTPRKHGPIKTPNRLNLDCGAVFYNRLVVAKFEQSRQGPVDFMEFYW